MGVGSNNTGGVYYNTSPHGGGYQESRIKYFGCKVHYSRGSRTVNVWRSNGLRRKIGIVIQVGQACSEFPQVARAADIIGPIPPSKNTQLSRFKIPSFRGSGEEPLTQRPVVRSTTHASTLGH